MGVRLSVIVIPLVGGAQTRRCVDALRHEKPDQLLVVPRGDETEPGHADVVRARTDFVPARRLAGALAADGDWLAFVEDTTLVAEGWGECARRLGAERDLGVLAGPVHLDPGLPARELALGICEYGAFSGDTTPQGVPGNAFVMRRALVGNADFAGGIYEDRLMAVLKRGGSRYQTHPGLAVTWSGGDERTGRPGARLRHGRLFGARRMHHAPTNRRLFLRLTCPGLLIWLPVRGAAWAVRRQCWRAVPHVVTMEFLRACGEITGYWRGAGRAAEGWR